MEAIRVYSARRIVTMNASMPYATHIAVRDKRILGFGGAEVLQDYGPVSHDDRFADKVLLPGFVEGHGHASEGLNWRHPYVGFFERASPEGRVWPGLKSIAEVLARLRQLEAALPAADGQASPLVAWGFDPIYFDGRRMTKADLDAVSQTRLILIRHASEHVMNVNTPVLAAAGFSRESHIDGLIRDASGELTGELQGPAVMSRAARICGEGEAQRQQDADSLCAYAALARRAGVTTSTDLGDALRPDTVDAFRCATSARDFPLRLVPALLASGYSPEDGVRRIAELRALNTDMLHFGPAKLVLDGSIQGFTARLRWPGYHNGARNGLWYLAPDELRTLIETYHRAGVQLHIHTNGDEAIALATEMIGRAVTAYPRPDHRHTLQHCQLADEALFTRMRAQGMCVNLFANHLFYWGDQHLALTLGPSRVRRLDPCGSALRAGVPLAIHSDAPVTPLAPLFTAWCAVNRLSSSGRVLGEDERISVGQALHAITLGAAYTLKLDHLIGSVDIGKFADLAVLDDDPLSLPQQDLKNIAVHATIMGGEVFGAA